MSQLEFHDEGWDQVVREVIDNTGVPMMQAVADACNIEAEESVASPARQLALFGQNQSHFMVSVEGLKRLRLSDYRVTVITATAYAMRKNAKDNILLRNFHRAAR